MECESFTLTEFRYAERAKLRAFTVWWRQQQERDPDRYPDRLPPDEWDKRVQDWFAENPDTRDPRNIPVL